MHRRHLPGTGAATAALILTLVLGVAAAGAAHAEWNPKRPLNVVVPYKAGGGTDLYARAIAAAADERLPVPVVIVNKPGAGGMTGAMAAASARPDGNTILMHSAGSFLLGHMFTGGPVDPFESFLTIAQIGNLTGALVVPADSPFGSVQDLVDAATADPGSLRWSHNGKGGTFHVLGQSFLNSEALTAVDVPFKGGSASRAALVGAQVDFGFLGIQQAKGFEEQLRVLAVAATERDALADTVPTFGELGFDVPIVSSPIVLFAPSGVDPEIVAGMEAAMKDITEAPEFAELVTAKGTFPAYLDGAGAEARLRQMQSDAQPVIDALKN